MGNCYHIYIKNTVPNKGFAKLLKIINKMLMKNNELSVIPYIQSKTGCMPSEIRDAEDTSMF